MSPSTQDTIFWGGGGARDKGVRGREYRDKDKDNSYLSKYYY